MLAPPPPPPSLSSSSPSFHAHFWWLLNLWEADPGPAVFPHWPRLWGGALGGGVGVLAHKLPGVQGAGGGGGGGLLRGEGGHGLSGLVAQGLGAGHGGRVRLQGHQVGHLELGVGPGD